MVNIILTIQFIITSKRMNVGSVGFWTKWKATPLRFCRGRRKHRNVVLNKNIIDRTGLSYFWWVAILFFAVIVIVSLKTLYGNAGGGGGDVFSQRYTNVCKNSLIKENWQLVVDIDNVWIGFWKYWNSLARTYWFLKFVNLGSQLIYFNSLIYLKLYLSRNQVGELHTI